MFAARYYPGRMFARRYFPAVGAESVQALPDTERVWKSGKRSVVWQGPKRVTVWKA
jgi:hypothetical protein